MELPRPADPGSGSGDRGLRLGFVPGVTPTSWARVWQERYRRTALLLVQVAAAEAERAVLAGDLDAALLRPPVDRDVLHAITLYAEEPVVVASSDHVLAALEPAEAVRPSDLADEVLLQPADDVLAWAGTPGAPADAMSPPGRAPRQVPATTADAIALVAAGVGVVVVPRSLARLHHRKDVTARPLADGPPGPVALVWPVEDADARIEDLIGVVRGRTVNSSRGRQPPAAEPQTRPPAPGRTPRRTGRDPRPPRRGGRRPR